jgi:hypothetical protein
VIWGSGSYSDVNSTDALVCSFSKGSVAIGMKYLESERRYKDLCSMLMGSLLRNRQGISVRVGGFQFQYVLGVRWYRTFKSSPLQNTAEPL